LPTKKALNGAGDHAQHHADGGQRQCKQDGNPEAVEQARQHVASAVVGAQPVACRWRRRVGRGRKVVERGVVVAVGRVQGPVAVFVELLFDEGVQPVGGGLEVTTEHSLGQGLHHREVPAPFVARQKRPVVGQQLCAEAQHKQHGKDQQADKAQPMAAKAQPGTARGRHLGKVGRTHRSNFTRGSTQT